MVPPVVYELSLSQNETVTAWPPRETAGVEIELPEPEKDTAPAIFPDVTEPPEMEAVLPLPEASAPERSSRVQYAAWPEVGIELTTWASWVDEGGSPITVNAITYMRENIARTVVPTRTAGDDRNDCFMRLLLNKLIRRLINE